MVDLHDAQTRADAEKIITDEVSSVSGNPSAVRGNGCAACHVLFAVKERMGVSEQDAADLLSEVLLENAPLNDRFIDMVEAIHMRGRLMGAGFVIKTREAKDRYVESNFKNTLAELLADLSSYGMEAAMRKLVLSHVALNIAQNLGVDYHAATEELYYYMRKNDSEMHRELTEVIRSISRKSREAGGSED